MKTNLFVLLSAFVFSGSLFASELYADLPKNDKVAVAARVTSRRLADENISTGTTFLKAYKLKVAPSQFGREEAVTSLKETFQYVLDQELPADDVARFKTTESIFDTRAVDTAVSYVAESNAYDTDNKETLLALRIKLSWPLGSLGAFDQPTKVFLSRSKVSQEQGEPRFVTQMVFVNIKTRLVIVLFTVEGEM